MSDDKFDDELISRLEAVMMVEMEKAVKAGYRHGVLEGATDVLNALLNNPGANFPHPYKGKLDAEAAAWALERLAALRVVRELDGKEAGR